MFSGKSQNFSKLQFSLPTGILCFVGGADWGRSLLVGPKQKLLCTVAIFEHFLGGLLSFTTCLDELRGMQQATEYLRQVSPDRRVYLHLAHQAPHGGPQHTFHYQQ